MTNLIVLSIPLYFLLIGIELLAERWQKTNRYHLHDALTNISCGLTQQVTGVFVKVIGVGAYVLLYQYAAHWHLPSTWTTGVLLFVLTDFCYYWAHRMSHEVNLFWGGHIVHHQSEDYNLSVALRQGSWQELFTFAFYLPLAVIGFEPTFFVIVSALVTIYQFWIHTEFIGRLGPLEWVLNTPSHHRVHHARNPRYLDRNYAGALIVWDRLFGTFEPEQERPIYGTTTPINTWNPVWANLDHYHQLWHQVRQTPGPADKLRTLFGRPGWRPNHAGGPYLVPEVDVASYRKYATPAPLSLNWYVVAQYAVLLGMGALFLFTQTTMPVYLRLLCAVWVAWSVVNMGGLFENRTWVRGLEPLRLLLLPVLVTLLVWPTPSFTTALAASTAWALGSVLVLRRLIKIANAVSQPVSDSTIQPFTANQ